MIIVYQPSASNPSHDAEQRMERHILGPDQAVPQNAVWIDLLNPTRQDDLKVEAFMGVSIPTIEDMKDIEPSELLYNENGARYMTARLLYKVDSDDPALAGVTFIMKEKTLVTVRYEEPRSFTMFIQRAARPGGCGRTAESVLAGLIETIIDRAADVLQLTGEQIDRLSRSIFEHKSDASRRNVEFHDTLRTLGRYGDLLSKQRESLVSVERILLFLSASYRAAGVPAELREELRTTLRDMQSLEEHASFLSTKIQFLLDATLGLVNLEQNNIIKLFSVMAVVFMPPTLIASIYGMNFKLMPELEWPHGYPMAIVMMVIAAILPYVLFRWKKWL